MGLYVMLTTLTDEGRKTIKEHPGRIKEVNKEVEAMGVKVICPVCPPGALRFRQYPGSSQQRGDIQDGGGAGLPGHPPDHDHGCDEGGRFH